MHTSLLTRGQVATRLGISPERVRQLTITGRLDCTVTPLGRLYREGDVQALAHEREARTHVSKAETSPADQPIPMPPGRARETSGQ